MTNLSAVTSRALTFSLFLGKTQKQKTPKKHEETYFPYDRWAGGLRRLPLLPLTPFLSPPRYASMRIDAMTDCHSYNSATSKHELIYDGADTDVYVEDLESGSQEVGYTTVPCRRLGARNLQYRE